MKYIDMHCHCHELEPSILEKIADKNIEIVCVSDDPVSSLKTIEYSRKYGVNPCVGIHPWEIHKHSMNELIEVIETGVKNNIKCLGEVGLDKRFYYKTFDIQVKFFEKILEYAREYDLVLNLHTPGAWNIVYDYLIRYDIDRAYFHWYTGPKKLVDNIVGSGYYLGINPAWKIQEKHRALINYIPLENMLTESDAPYKYRGLELSPYMVIESIKYIAETRSMDEEEVVEKIWSNYIKLFSFQ